LSGGNGNDRLSGDAGNDRLDGNAGNDRLSGASGNDSLNGGAGTDDLHGGAGGDRLLGGSGRDGLNGGADNDRLSGGSGNDGLQGAAGNDRLSGDSGNDRLNGGLDADVLSGGFGFDTFTFNTALGAGNIDTIRDFRPFFDRVTLDDAVFTGLSTGALTSDAFRVGAFAFDSTDRIIYNAFTGALFFDPDGAGGTEQVQFATLRGSPNNVTVLDFFVI
jgi:Ca2+-binding RTX toxin-like protein